MGASSIVVTSEYSIDSFKVHKDNGLGVMFEPSKSSFIFVKRGNDVKSPPIS
jgi:hypothetical protein